MRIFRLRAIGGNSGRYCSPVGLFAILIFASWLGLVVAAGCPHLVEYFRVWGPRWYWAVVFGRTRKSLPV